jgi:hypothetical protein
MKKISYLFILVMVMLFGTAPSARAQTDTFSDPNVDYSFAVPDAKWKMTTKPSQTSPNVEYVYGDKIDGHLEVRKVTVAKDAVLSDIIQNEDQKLRFRPGFVAGKQEQFTGKLRGAIFNFEYVAAGKSMSGRFYFMRANPTTVYILRFTAQKDALRSIQNQTDSMARTFSVSSTT